MKENQRLQNELRIKNDTIAGLINQNFNELKILKEKHDKMINDISTSHENSINTINHKYVLFRKSLCARMKENINTHCKVNSERILILSNHNQELMTKIIELQKDIENKGNKINFLDNELFETNRNYQLSDLKNKELENTMTALKIQLSDVTISLEKYMNLTTENEKIILELTEFKKKLVHENSNHLQEISDNSIIIKKLTDELKLVKKTNYEIQNKNISLLNDNMNKQTLLDEKNLENVNLFSKIDDLERKNSVLETSKKDLVNKITDMFAQFDNLNLELATAQKKLNQIKLEKETIIEEKDFYLKELENYRNKLKEQESVSLKNIEFFQEKNNKEKEILLSEHNTLIKELINKYENQITSLKNEINTTTIDKNQRIDGLMIHLKTITDNQYIAFSELEKIKSHNETLKNENSIVDQKINSINMEHKKEMDMLTKTYNNEKEFLVESYKETIKKLQDSNELLQHRLNQSIEALSLSKTTISNLKDSKQDLERKIQTKESEDKTCGEKNKDLINENSNLKEKLSRSLEVSNELSNKEKIYENQIKLLQSKYNQLLLLTKKNINSSNSNN